ncbi:MAG: hypothetical protein F6K30_12460 [Cyanothece sp. SIO2G6]|nr:hypothetical protein [Cyanothece sp. SIO2G6]
MTTSPFPIPPPDSPWIDATVTALTCRSPALGDRIYAIFNAVDGFILRLLGSCRASRSAFPEPRGYHPTPSQGQRPSDTGLFAC